VFPAQLEKDYIEALGGEIGSAQWPWIPETVYIGGGTPSSVAAETFPALLAGIPGRDGWKEATLEAAPGSLTEEKVRAWRESGITRVSLGVQSFVDAEIRRTGRKHTAQTVSDDVALLRAHGIRDISIDLIAGLAAQTDASWRESLEQAARLEVPHASIYMLEVDDDSRLGRELMLGGVRYGAMDVPGEGSIIEFYESGVDFLARIGLRRYEISNFARPGSESVHNLKYWKLEPYLGFGADAHSYDGEMRWANVETAAEYVERARVGVSPRLESVRSNPAEERFFVGLRLLEGITPTREQRAPHEAAIQRMTGEGLLEESSGTLRLTRRGVLLSNEVFGEFLQS
jgi:oxygen-independent coproporphyrinogen-3 oxidase